GRANRIRGTCLANALPLSVSPRPSHLWSYSPLSPERSISVQWSFPLPCWEPARLKSGPRRSLFSAGPFFSGSIKGLTAPPFEGLSKQRGVCLLVVALLYARVRRECRQSGGLVWSLFVCRTEASADLGSGCLENVGAVISTWSPQLDLPGSRVLL
ncbi:hypothetical protein KUCAC02_022174, partial [Chaenocephalus aceratus]